MGRYTRLEDAGLMPRQYGPVPSNTSHALYQPVRACRECALYAGCQGPVPPVGPVNAAVMLILEGPGCFAAGTPVSTPTGTVPIECIKTGDLVIGRTGQPQKVTRTFQRLAPETVNVRLRGGHEFICTPEHPVLALSSCSCGARKLCSPSWSGCRNRDGDGEWAPAAALTSAHWLLVPVSEAPPMRFLAPHSPDIVKLDVSAYWRRFPKAPTLNRRRPDGAQSGPFRQLRFGRGMGLWCGWYMAEGSGDIRSGAVTLSVNSTTDRYSRLSLLASQLFPTLTSSHKPSPSTKSNQRTVRVYSQPLVALFLALFGTGARNKRVPSPIFSSPREVRERFLWGWYQGDGHHRNKHDGIATSSIQALYDGRLLLTSLGVWPTIRSSEPGIYSFGGGTCYSLQFIGQGSARGKSGSWLGVPFPRNYRRLGGYFAVRVKDTSAAGSRPVYNLETEDNTYCVPFIVHNSNEDRWGIPVTGATWAELAPLLRLTDLSRDTIWLSNTVFCRVPGDPSLGDTEVCWEVWKRAEFALVRPSVVMLLGQLAVQRFFDNPSLTVAEVRGFPLRYRHESLGWEGIVIASYHPAASLYQDTYRPALREDFLGLRRLKMGEFWERPVDQYPEPDYRAGLPAWL